MTNSIFVYGTLKMDGRLSLKDHDGAEFITVTETNNPFFDMIDLGSFPGVTAGDSYVVGQLWEVDDITFKQLDRIEGYPDFYRRQIVETLHGPAWMYYLSPKDFPTADIIKPNEQNRVEWKNT